MKKFLKNIFLLLTIIYAIFVFSHTFLPQTELNKYLSTRFFIAHFYSFPILFGLIASFISIIFLLIIYFRKNAKIQNLYFISWGLILISSICFIFLSNDFTIKKFENSNKKSFKIVEWNTLNNLDNKDTVKIFKNFDTDIAVFPELDADKLKNSFKKANLNIEKYNIFESKKTHGGIAPVTIAVKKEFENYKEGFKNAVNKRNPMTTFGTVYLNSNNENKPDIVGVHTAPPLPFLMDLWKRDLKFISDEVIKKYPNSIIVGDFNATLRHGEMSEIKSHTDALNYLLKFKRGTWHKNIFSYFRSPIDHILIPNKYGVKNIQVEKFENSDHIAIFAEIVEK